MNSSFSFNSFVYAFTSWCHWSALHIAELEFLISLWRRDGKQKVAGTQCSIFFFYVRLLFVNLYCKDWRFPSKNYILPQYLEGGFFYLKRFAREHFCQMETQHKYSNPMKSTIKITTFQKVHTYILYYTVVRYSQVFLKRRL